MNAGLPQSLKEADEPRIGILETTGIDKLDALTDTIVVDAAIVRTLAEGCPTPRAIVFEHLAIHIAAAMTLRREVIVAQAYIVTILLESLHLIVYLFRDTAMFGKTVIYQE
jgi:hypothetical protein